MNLREVRRKAGLTQSQLAKKLGVSQAAYSGWEVGRSRIDTDSLLVLSDLFGVSVDYLLGNSPEESLSPLREPLTAGAWVPVLGRVPAGVPIEAVEDIIDKVQLNERMTSNGHEYFALLVTGDSMYPEYKDGDIVIVKKQDTADSGKDVVAYVNSQEVQEGWLGHVLPFALVQGLLLPDELQALKDCEARISEISGEYESLLDELSEEDKEKDFTNDNKDAFVAAEVKKAIKAKEVEPETLAILKKVDVLVTEEKALKKKAKDDAAVLHIKTKNTIENLDDATVLNILKHKWIVPLTESIETMPQTVLKDFVAKLEALCKKYETTFAAVEEQIKETEMSLIGFIDELTGNEFDMQGLKEFKILIGGE